MKVHYSDRYLYSLPAGHRFPIEKYGLIRQQLLLEGVVDEQDLLEPVPCDEGVILRAHHPSYWERVKGFELNDQERRKLGIPLHRTSLLRAMSSVNATLSAARDAMEDGLAFNLGGGTHHAFKDRGEAFSILNDLAITCSVLLNEGCIDRVLLIDLDVHQGNGTASMLKEEDRAFTFSMHGAGNYPFRKVRSDRDLEFPDGTGDLPYLEVLEQELEMLLSHSAPDLILYQAGVDVMEGDQLGRLAMSKEGCRERDAMVFQKAAEKGVPVAVTMGGGYHERTAEIVDAHAASFREGKKAFS